MPDEDFIPYKLPFPSGMKIPNRVIYGEPIDLERLKKLMEQDEYLTPLGRRLRDEKNKEE